MTYYLFLAAAIVLEVIATTLLKASNGFTVLIPAVSSLLFYTVSFYCLSICLTHVPTGVAYAIWSGFGIILITILSFLIFKQTLDIPAITGIVLIITGVVIMQLFSKTV